MVDIVNGVLVRNKRVLMALRTSDRRSYPGTWSFPGGHVEAGETLAAALTRELLEEIGVTPQRKIILATLEGEAGGQHADVTFYLFAVKAWSGELANLGDEHERLDWFDFDEAKKLPNLALEAYREILGVLQRGEC